MEGAPQEELEHQYDMYDPNAPPGYDMPQAGPELAQPPMGMLEQQRHNAQPGMLQPGVLNDGSNFLPYNNGAMMVSLTFPLLSLHFCCSGSLTLLSALQMGGPYGQHVPMNPQAINQPAMGQEPFYPPAIPQPGAMPPPPYSLEQPGGAPAVIHPEADDHAIVPHEGNDVVDVSMVDFTDGPTVSSPPSSLKTFPPEAIH